MDLIEISGLRVFGHHGVHQAERERGQTFVVDVGLDLDVSVAAASDDLAETVDYAALAGRVADAVADTRFRLLEALAGHIAELCLADARVAAARVRVAKPDVDLPLDLDEVAVVVHRGRGDGNGP